MLLQEGNPGPVTISSDQALVAAPPPPAPLTPSDPSDPSTSLFGSRTKFDGLGVIFDTAPKAPLYRRSDPRNWAGDAPFGVSNSAVVSGILDDGSGEWLEPDKRVMGGEDNDEAAYLEKAIGECEAVLRGNAGLLWSRISYVNHTIRVSSPSSSSLLVLVELMANSRNAGRPRSRSSHNFIQSWSRLRSQLFLVTWSQTLSWFLPRYLGTRLWFH